MLLPKHERHRHSFDIKFYLNIGMFNSIQTVSLYYSCGKSNSGFDSFFPLSEDGYLQPWISSTSTISQIEMTILEYLNANYERLWDHRLLSVYFLGIQPYPKNKVKFVTAVVIDDDTSVEGSTSFNVSLLNRNIPNNFPHIKEFITIVIYRNHLKDNKYHQFILKVLSIRVFGEPIEKDIQNFRPNNEIVFLIHRLDDKVDTAKRALEEGKWTDLQLLSFNLINYLLRCAFELVIERENAYTRNIYMCQKLFSKYYPQYESISERLLLYSESDSSDTVSFFDIVNEFSSILKKEYSLI